MLQPNGPPAWKHLRDILLLPFTVTCVIPWLLHDAPAPWFPQGLAVRIAGAVLMLAGLALFATTVALFVRTGRGTLAPWTPTQRLIVTGPYRYCRNPMISGVLFILLGETLLLRSPAIGIEAVVFFLINTAYFILKEEPALLNRFGDAYRSYQRDVPRWIPKWPDARK